MGHLCLLGDTPASNFIAGFKEGVGLLRKCRMCMATEDDIKEKVIQAVYIIIVSGSLLVHILFSQLHAVYFHSFMLTSSHQEMQPLIVTTVNSLTLTMDGLDTLSHMESIGLVSS